MYWVILNDELTIELAMRISSVENMHSIPKAIVWRDLSGRESTEMSVSFGKNRLKVGEGSKFGG
jgi:hypothetical protein